MSAADALPPRATTVAAPPTSPGRRLERVPFRSGRGIVGFTLLGLLGLAVVAIVLPPILEYARGSATATPTLTAALMWANIAFQVVLFVGVPVLYLRTVRPGERVRDLLCVRVGVNAVGDIVKGVGIGVAVLLLLAGVVFALRAVGVVTEDESLLVGEIGRLVRAHPEFILAAPLAAGVCEETFFRGFLQPRIGILASNVVFGLVHLGYGTVLQLVLPAVVGVLFGVTFARTRSLWTCIAAHATFDFVQLAILYIAGPGTPSIVGFF